MIDICQRMPAQPRLGSNPTGEVQQGREWHSIDARHSQLPDNTTDVRSAIEVQEDLEQLRAENLFLKQQSAGHGGTRQGDGCRDARGHRDLDTPGTVGYLSMSPSLSQSPNRNESPMLSPAVTSNGF